MSTSEIIHSILAENYKQTQHASCKVVGNSMFPLIRKGDWIYIEPITENNLQSGDIILFSVNQRFVVHRIVNIENDQLVTKGDWSRSLDPSITKVNVIGKLVAIKKGKYKLTLNHPFLRIQNQLIRLLNQKILNFRLRRIN